jgi:hypothetical protein
METGSRVYLKTVAFGSANQRSPHRRCHIVIWVKSKLVNKAIKPSLVSRCNATLWLNLTLGFLTGC